MARAFSYSRFSTKRQEKGRSFKRQFAIAKQYAADHGLDLDDRSFQDLGISAFKGRNLREGSLGLFLEAVESGDDPSFQNCYLLVESIDRITREPVMDALATFQRIVRNGVTLVTIADGFSYSAESLSADWTKLIVALSHMSRAHNETHLKSTRSLANWVDKKTKAVSTLHADQRIVMKSIMPSWLTRKPDGSGFIVDQNKAKTIKRIFKLSLQGEGSTRIAHALNAEKVPLVTERKPRSLVDDDGDPITYVRARTDDWTNSKVLKILQNPAVAGNFAPLSGDVIPGYFPKIVDDTTYLKAQDTLKTRLYMRAPDESKLHYLFTGLGECALCNSRMKLVSIAVRSVGTRSYLRCRNSLEGTRIAGKNTERVCEAATFPYRPAEAAILRYLADDLAVQMSAVHESPDHVSVAMLMAQRDDFNLKLNNLIELASTARNPKPFAPKIDALQIEIERLESAMLDVRPVTYQKERMAESAELFDIFKGFSGPMEIGLRKRVQMELRNVLEAVYFMPPIDGDPLSVAIQYVKSLGHGTRHIKIATEKVGGNRRKADL